ncbi:MAG: hypothetical protein HFE49_07820 [Clostridia bacterium]|nr:hypothetical protein [Clostridia bacterium]
MMIFMIDVNAEAQKALSGLGCKVVYQYPETFNAMPVISYYNLAEKGAFYADNSECIQDGYIQVDIWSKIPKECADISIMVNSAMERDGWTRELSMDMPKKNEKVYHRTMRFQKYFTL